MTDYPKATEDGRTVWACCESSIGPVCRHLTITTRTPDLMPGDRFYHRDGEITVIWGPMVTSTSVNVWGEVNGIAGWFGLDPMASVEVLP